MKEASVLDATTITTFLEAYPLPAFVVALPSSQATSPFTPVLARRRRSATVSQSSAGPSSTHKQTLPPLSPPLTPRGQLPPPLWANKRWHHAARGQSLQECLSAEDAQLLVEWLSHRSQQASSQQRHGVKRDRRHAPALYSSPPDDIRSPSEDGVHLDVHRDNDPARSPEIDLRTRDGVRRWAETISAPVRPHPIDYDEHRRYSTIRRPRSRVGKGAAALGHWRSDDEDPDGAPDASSVRSPPALRSRSRSKSRRRATARTLTLEFTFPHQRRARRVELLCTVLLPTETEEDGGGETNTPAAWAVVTFASSRSADRARDRDEARATCSGGKSKRRRVSSRSGIRDWDGDSSDVDTDGTGTGTEVEGDDTEDEDDYPTDRDTTSSSQPLHSPMSEGRPARTAFNVNVTDLSTRRSSVPAVLPSRASALMSTSVSAQSSPTHESRNLSLSENGDPAADDVESLPRLVEDDETAAKVGRKFAPGEPIFLAGDGSIKSVPAGAKPVTAKDPNSVAHLLETHDWSSSPLGPLASWPAGLRSIVAMMSLFPLPTAVWWGRELTFLYNQAFSKSVANHPQLYGAHGRASLEHLRASLGDLTGALLAGSSIYKDDEFFLHTDENGNRRESYRSLLWAPIKNEKGYYDGIWHATRDTTPKVIADRRLELIRDLGAKVSTSRTLHDFERGVLDALQLHPKDAPFAMLYFVDEQLPMDRPGAHFERVVRLRRAGGVGVPTEHPSAPEVVTVTVQPPFLDGYDLSLTPVTSHVLGDRPFTDGITSSSYSGGSPAPSAASTFESTVASQDPGWQFAEVLATRTSVVVDCEDRIHDYPLRAWDELPSKAIVVPICLNSEGDLPAAVMVLGISARLDFDNSYDVFVQDLRFNMASYLSAVRSYDADQRRLGDLASLDRAKSMLFSNVSHELLVPLTLIAGPLDDVIVDLEDGSKKDSLVMCRRNVSRLSRLVSMLVDISNLDAGQLRGSFTRVNLGALTRDVAGQFQKAAAQMSLEYTIACDEKPRNVFIDRERWEKILFSLIENALKYTEKGFVKVSLEYSHKQAILTVADSGVGIPSATVDELNQGFFPRGAGVNMALSRNVSSRDAENVGSSGISLTFAKKLVQLHHGEFEIESKTARESVDGSHGTTFRVRIPLGSGHLPPDAVMAPSTSEGLDSSANAAQFGREMIEEVSLWHTERDKEDSESTSATISGDSTSATISVSSSGTRRSKGIDGNMLNFTSKDVVMIVEDMPDARRYMRTIFEPFCKVVMASNGREALQKYETHQPDLIISDVMLPGMTGMQLLDTLRAGTRDQQLVPVILLAAADDVRTNGMLRADDYISKPFNARELIVRANIQLQMGKERRMLEQLFEERTQELRLLSDHSPAGILRCDESGKLIYANLAWHKMAGVPVGKIPMAEEYLHESCSALAVTWKQFIESDEAVIDMEARWNNGRWISFKLARLDNSVPGKGGFIGSAIDVTERMLNEDLQRQRIAEAEKRRAEAEEARQQQELLIDITSHEIRNPISSILQISVLWAGWMLTLHCSSMVRSNLLVLQEEMQNVVEAREALLSSTSSQSSVAEGPPPPGTFRPTKQLLVSLADDLEALDSIYQCGLAQERISNDVLSLGKMQLDLLHMFDVETSIPNVARKVISIFQNEARMNRITLNLDIAPTFEELGLTSVMTDPVRLSQIVTNLLSNAIRFTANSKERRIELRVDASLQPPVNGSCLIPKPAAKQQLCPGMPVYVHMSVSDTGPGLTPAELEKLFQRFAQASPMTHTVFGGSGLGLFVCRKLAERMGGQIEVSSEYGKGSQFRFYIRTTWLGKNTPTTPRAPALLGAPMTPTASQQRTERAAKPPTVTRKLRILVVEDNLINRTVLLRQLKHVGIDADSAMNGLEALTKISKAMGLGAGSELEPFDCVLMDLEMPVMDGYTAARRVRADEAAGKLKKSLIIALTGNARQAQIQEGMADFDAAVIKPYRLDDLLRKVEELMDARDSATGNNTGG